jgi:hypothetical protein
MKKNDFIVSAILILVFYTAGVLGASPVPQPQPVRNYMIVFQLDDYTSQVKKAVDNFFDNVLQQGDNLIIVTPARMLAFSAQKLAANKKKILADIQKALKADINQMANKKRAILLRMQEIAESINEDGTSDEPTLNSYKQYRAELDALRGGLEANLMKYSQIFRSAKGENHMLMILQEEFRPVPKDTSKAGSQALRVLDAVMKDDDAPQFDVEKVKAAYKYAKVRFHFLYFQDKRRSKTSSLRFVDNLASLYKSFSDICATTNGVKLKSTNPSLFVKQIKQVVLEGKVETEVVDTSMEK